MRILKQILPLFLFLVTTGCITEFIPDIGVDPEFFVVEGIITDQPGRHYIRLSRSMPLGTEAEFHPLSNCTVWISDDLNNKFQLSESDLGIYMTDVSFCGEAGRKYTLNIKTGHFQPPYNIRVTDHTLKSLPMEMLPVPEIDTLYYEKVMIREEDGFAFPGEGCQVLLNTSDPENKCKYYRWDYAETWKVVAPNYPLTLNRICWITNNSEDINIKDATGLTENRIDRLPVKFISNQTDRLLVRYRIAVNQYSISEDEYNYWSDLERITENTGNLYDFIPSAIQGNLFCTDDPDRQVLGYFSVSAKRSKFIYIDEFFEGQFRPYENCERDTLFRNGDPLPFYPLLYNIYVQRGYWFVEDRWDNGGFVIVSRDRGCVDCTGRGTTKKPDFWEDGDEHSGEYN